MDTSVAEKVETRFIKDGLVVHTNDLGPDFIDMTLKGLARDHGRGGWSTESRTITVITVAADWA